MRSITLGASCLVVVAACSNHPRESTAGAEAGVSVPPAVIGGRVAESIAARTIIESVRTRFRPALVGAPALGPASHPLVQSESGIAVDANGLAARVTYPTRANDKVRVFEPTSGIEVAYAPLGAAASEAEVADGLVVYRDAFGAGTPLLHRPTGDGTEDFVLLEHAPASPRVSFSFELGEKVSGLRLVGNVLELVDAKGAPRLRVASPWLVGRDGHVIDAELSVEGCAYDADPAPPWDRPTRDPGARVCTLHVRWDRDAVQYPALLDPAWQSTVMTPYAAVSRNDATLTACTGTGAGRVLVAGGSNPSSGAVLATADVYSASTNTWASTASMATARTGATAAMDTTYNTNVYVTGGRNGSGAALASTERYNCGTGAGAGTWSSAGSFATARYGHALAIGGGRAWAVGGRTNATTLAGSLEHNQLSNSWIGVTGSQAARVEVSAVGANSFPATTLADGGCVAWFGGRDNAGTALDTSAIFCLGVDWSGGIRSGPKMTAARGGYRMATIGATRHLLTGGIGAGGTTLSTTEVFDANSYNAFAPSGFSAGSAMPVARSGHVAIALNGTDVLVAGGSAATTSHLYLGSTGTWLPAGTLLGNHGAGIGGAPLPSSGALVVGGTAAPERWSRQSAGATCSDAGECTSGFCVDGFCCNTACTALCQACSNALTGAANGTCTNTKSGGSSKGACGATSASSCGDDGTCNGSGACRKWPSGTECQAQSCASTTLQNNKRTCNGTGGCLALTTTACTAPYVCTSLGAVDGCATSCTGTDDTKCAPGFFCNGSTCVAGLAKATTCSRDRQCATGFCADGVCCGTRCGGSCEACTAAFKKSGADGDCGNVPADTDPRDKCAKDAGYPNSCKADGFCNGSGACRNFAVAGVECAAPACTSGKATTSICDGSGVCNLTEKSCAPDTCNTTGTACAGSCGVDTDCASTAFCDAATKKCTPKKVNGTDAKETRECQSGLVADGVCCNDVCTGSCEACDGAATKGTCTAVAGKSRHEPACAAGTADNPCSAASCDGTERKSCVAKAGADIVCRAASCGNGVETIETRCEGSGACPTSATKNCLPFACDGTACKVKCTVNADCADGFFCDPASGICGAGASCVDDSTLKRSDGTTQTCIAFKCSGQKCLDKCTSTADCLSGFVCNPSSTQCEPAPSGDADGDGGCAIENAQGGSTSPIALLGIGLAVTLFRRRRPRSA